MSDFPEQDDRPSLGATTRRAVIGGIGAAAVGYAVFGPRSIRTGSSDRIRLDYWEKWTAHEADAMRTVVDRFNESQDRIFVNYLTMGGIDSKAKLAIAAGDPPDILGLWNRNLPFFDQCGALEPLDGLKSYGIDASSYAEAIRPLVFRRGEQLAAPSTPSSIILYYNRKILADSGWDPDRPPRTIPEFDEMIAKTTVFKANGDVERAGFLPTDPGWWSWSWGGFFGGGLYDEKTGRATVDSPPMVAAYDWYQSFPRRWGLDRLRAFQGAPVDNPSPYRGFFSGRLASTVQGPWLPMFMKDQLKEKAFEYGACFFPVAEGLEDQPPYGPIETDILVIPKGARHPEASLEFIAFTQRPENIETLCSGHAKPSPLASSSEEFREDHPNTAVEVHEKLLQSPNAYTTPWISSWQEFAMALGAGLDAIWNLRSPSALEPLREVQGEVEEILARAAARRERRGQRDPWLDLTSGPA
ncbi:MAG: extracellular solute-binding protein [Planctomycetota bacterium]|nr:extracellular solute-binding protein [Planctomycetota bacterium]